MSRILQTMFGELNEAIEAVEILRMLNHLRDNEGVVMIGGDVTDMPYRSRIMVKAEYTGGVMQPFNGDSLHSCLRAAMVARASFYKTSTDQIPARRPANGPTINSLPTNGPIACGAGNCRP